VGMQETVVVHTAFRDVKPSGRADSDEGGGQRETRPPIVIIHGMRKGFCATLENLFGCI
jgi:hypothetical protein